MVVLQSTGASRYHNCCIDGGTSPECFGHTLVKLFSWDVRFELTNCQGIRNENTVGGEVYLPLFLNLRHHRTGLLFGAALKLPQTPRYPVWVSPSHPYPSQIYPTSQPHNPLNIQSIPVLIHRLTTTFSPTAPDTPSPHSNKLEIILQPTRLTCTNNININVRSICWPGQFSRYSYELDGPGIESRWWDYSHPSRPALGPTQPPIQWGTGLSPGVKQSGRGVDHPPSTIVEVKERVELYFYSPSGPLWPVLGWTLPLPFTKQIQVLL
jgi:hypothetical protein